MPEESDYFKDGEWVLGGADTRTSVHRPAPTRADRLYFEGGPGVWQRPSGRNWETGELDTGLYERQMAGISALISLANDVAVATGSSETISSPAGGRRKQSRLSVISRLRQDEMTWNSLFLIMSTGLQSGSGFIFWIIAARLFSVSDVGKGSALISGAGLIGILSLVGLNSGMARYLPNARNRDALISSGLAVVAVIGALGGLLYILLTPLIAPRLAFVEKSPVLTIGFVLITSAAAVNTLTDVIFVASRKAKYTTFVDGVIGGLGKVALVSVLTGAGAYGVFLASAIGTVLAAAASLLLIMTAMHVRIDLRGPLKTLKPLLRFSGANYIGTVMNIITVLIVPIILLDRLGAESAGYFFVVLQMAQIVYTAALALEQTFLTEGSRADADMHQLRRRSLRLIVLFFLLSAVILIGLGRWLLLAFGQPYYHYGYTSLIILVLAAGPISANYWLQTILRLAGKLRAVIVVNVTGAIGTCSCVWIGSSHGLTGVAWGWLGGALITTCVAGAAVREGRPWH
jgi:O-antigen/teichoic acid export membrane protein